MLANDSFLSKIQCVIKYVNHKWIIQDGNGKEDNQSKNGTWIYANEETNIYDSMIFKANKLRFEAKLKKI